MEEIDPIPEARANDNGAQDITEVRTPVWVTDTWSCGWIDDHFVRRNVHLGIRGDEFGRDQIEEFGRPPPEYVFSLCGQGKEGVEAGGRHR